MACNWCGPAPHEEDPADLCRAHEAEYEGVSETELDRRDDEQRMERD